jgi:hypothetical protein
MPNTHVTGIAFTDLNPGYSERFSHDASAIQRPVGVDWNLREPFLHDMLGYSYLSGAGTLHRSLPGEHPELPGFWCTAADTIQTLRPTSAEADPDFHVYDGIHYNLTYQPLPYDVLSDDIVEDLDGELSRFVERKINHTGENLTVGTGSFTWVTAPNEPLFAPPTKIFPVVEMEYIWRRVPRVPWVNIENCIGKVNSLTFDTQATKWGVPEGGFLAQTVLFMGARAELLNHESSIFGSASHPAQWDIYYKFLYRSNADNGWNYLWRPTANAFQLVTHNGLAGGNRIYETENFSTLFRLF